MQAACIRCGASLECEDLPDGFVFCAECLARPVTLSGVQTDAVQILAIYAVFDRERAHMLEDALWRRVLQAIADGTIQELASAIAGAALKTRLTAASRWYA